MKTIILLILSSVLLCSCAFNSAADCQKSYTDLLKLNVGHRFEECYITEKLHPKGYIQDYEVTFTKNTAEYKSSPEETKYGIRLNTRVDSYVNQINYSVNFNHNYWRGVINFQVIDDTIRQITTSVQTTKLD